MQLPGQRRWGDQRGGIFTVCVCVCVRVCVRVCVKQDMREVGANEESESESDEVFDRSLNGESALVTPNEKS